MYSGIGPQSNERAFVQSKQLHTSAKVLAHYNPKLDVVVASDASANGIRTVLSHKLPTGEERPVALASRTLTSAERNYTQVDKEVWACNFAVKRSIDTDVVGSLHYTPTHPLQSEQTYIPSGF